MRRAQATTKAHDSEFFLQLSVALSAKVVWRFEGMSMLPNEVPKFSDQYLNGEISSIIVCASWHQLSIQYPRRKCAQTHAGYKRS